MAKRGYRGKHPHNDMKVSVKNPSSNKYSSKLTTEYKKLQNNKQKYDYIRTHYYYPQSTCTLTIGGTGPADGSNIVIISTDGTSVTYEASSSAALSANKFSSSADGTSLAAAINNSAGHNGKITAVGSAGQVLLTQFEPGPDGDKTVSGSATNITASNQASGIASINGRFSF